MKSTKIALYIDGENLRHYVETVLQNKGYNKKDFSILNIDFEKMFSGALAGYRLSTKIYYSARLQLFKGTEDISKILISKQRYLKTKLEKQKYQFLIAGNVRPQVVRNGSKNKIVFKEKGVDVRIAVDLIKSACDKEFDTVILCSSDSDLQPAIRESRNRGLKIIYLGFEDMPNKGLTFTTDKTILLRSSEIIKALDKTIQLEI